MDKTWLSLLLLFGVFISLFFLVLIIHALMHVKRRNKIINNVRKKKNGKKHRKY